MIQQTQSRKRRKRRETIRKRDDSQRKIIDQAKALLIERNNMSEEEAHRYLQKSSMESGTNMLETAQMVLTIMNDKRQLLTVTNRSAVNNNKGEDCQ